MPQGVPMASSRHFCPFSTGKISLFRDGQSLFPLLNDKQGTNFIVSDTQFAYPNLEEFGQWQ